MKNHFVKKVWISSAIIICSIIIAAGVSYYYAGDIATQADALNAKRAAVYAQNNSLDNLATLKAEAPQADQYMAAMNQYLPDQYAVLQFIPWAATAGQKYNVSVTAVFSGSGQPSSMPSLTTPGSIPFSISIQGPPGDAVAFLKYLETPGTGFPLSITSFDYTISAGTEKINAQGNLFFH